MSNLALLSVALESEVIITKLQTQVEALQEALQLARKALKEADVFRRDEIHRTHIISQALRQLGALDEK